MTMVLPQRSRKIPLTLVIGGTLFILGCGPLIVIVLVEGRESNPVLPGMVASVVALPSLVLILHGVWEMVRNNQKNQ